MAEMTSLHMYLFTKKTRMPNSHKKSLIVPNPGYDDPLVDFIAVYKSGYPNSHIWKTIFSPDGIVLGYFYIEAPQISAKPNLDIELKE